MISSGGKFCQLEKPPLLPAQTLKCMMLEMANWRMPNSGNLTCCVSLCRDPRSASATSKKSHLEPKKERYVSLSFFSGSHNISVSWEAILPVETDPLGQGAHCPTSSLPTPPNCTLTVTSPGGGTAYWLLSPPPWSHCYPCSTRQGGGWGQN